MSPSDFSLLRDVPPLVVAPSSDPTPSSDAMSGAGSLSPIATLEIAEAAAYLEGLRSAEALALTGKAHAITLLIDVAAAVLDLRKRDAAGANASAQPDRLLPGKHL